MSPTKRSPRPPAVPRRAARSLSIAPHPQLDRFEGAAVGRPGWVRARARRAAGKFLLAARPDTVDFRDLMYVTSLVEVPREKPLAEFLVHKVPILDQGEEGACTGFGLATVVHYLLRTRAPSGTAAEQESERRFNRDPVSPHMLYRMARRYDEWAGEDDDGSSARGAMKGWHKHGVCSLAEWKAAGRGTSDTLLTEARAVDALLRPLGGYYRVNHTDVVAMHAALSEVGILYATAWVHDGWDAVKSEGKDAGRIPFTPKSVVQGGHAFAIVAFDATGFWIQNSWGRDWGRGGFCHISYDDWLTNGTDVWVGRLGAPVGLSADTTAAAAAGRASTGAKTPLAIAELRPHVISIGNEGALRTTGILGTDAAAVDHLFREDFPSITKGWAKRRLLLYAHGGLCDEEGALQRVQDYRRALLDAEVYPVAFVWKTDYWTTLSNALDDAQRRRKPEGVLLDKAKDFLLNRVDDALEPIARIGTGKLEWDEMKENGLDATLMGGGGARLVAHYVQQLAGQGVEIHVAGHSAGSIFMAPLVRLLATRGAISWDGVREAASEGAAGSDTGLAVPVKTVTMWAPACTIDLWDACYRPCVDQGGVERFALFTMTDPVEQDDDCAQIYHKSLLYLVSHAFEKRLRNPMIPVIGDKNLDAAGVGILGMEWWLTRDKRTKGNRFQVLDGTAPDPGPEGRCVWIRSPNTQKEGSRNASASRHHGDFDDDGATVRATLARILGRKTYDQRIAFGHTAAGNAALLRKLNR